jgi:hypothetical protein
MTTCHLEKSEQRMLTAQQRFNERYITSAEIQEQLGINRHVLHYARKSRKLPEAIEVQPGVLFIWERTPELEQFLSAWKIMLSSRKEA